MIRNWIRLESRQYRMMKWVVTLVKLGCIFYESMPIIRINYRTMILFCRVSRFDGGQVKYLFGMDASFFLLLSCYTHIVTVFYFPIELLSCLYLKV
jgi:hypothetical protein